MSSYMKLITQQLLQEFNCLRIGPFHPWHSRETILRRPLQLEKELHDKIRRQPVQTQTYRDLVMQLRYVQREIAGLRSSLPADSWQQMYLNIPPSNRRVQVSDELQDVMVQELQRYRWKIDPIEPVTPKLMDSKQTKALGIEAQQVSFYSTCLEGNRETLNALNTLEELLKGGTPNEDFNGVELSVTTPGKPTIRGVFARVSNNVRSVPMVVEATLGLVQAMRQAILAEVDATADATREAADKLKQLANPASQA